MRFRRALTLWAATLGALGGSAGLAEAATVSLQTSALHGGSYRAMYFGHSFSLSGTLSSRRAHVKLALEANPFPFSGGFHVVAEQSTGAGGAFRFRAGALLATEYRASVIGRRSAVSRILTVYSIPARVRSTCSGCSNLYPGVVLRVVTLFRVPRSLAADQAALPVYVYLNVVAGNRPSTTVSRLKTTHARLIGPGLIRVTYSVRLEPPVASGTWSYTADSCQPSDEPRTGFGLPGHHQCGSRVLTGVPQTYHW